MDIDFIKKCVPFAEDFKMSELGDHLYAPSCIHSFHLPTLNLDLSTKWTKLAFPRLLTCTIDGINREQGKWRIIQTDNHIRVYDSESGFKIPELICKFSEMTENEAKIKILECVFENGQ